MGFTLSWMAWTWPTALFFLFIASLLIGMIVWEKIDPGGNPRRGILGLDTTRGDRLFLSLLGSAFIHLIWLALMPFSLWIASLLSLIYAILVFRFV